MSIPAPLRKKRIWTVTDFATFMGVSSKSARAILKRLDREVGGMLLRKSEGKKPEYTFFPAMLAKAKPEVFERLETIESRVDEIEAEIETLRREQRMIVSQVGSNTRALQARTGGRK